MNIIPSTLIIEKIITATIKNTHKFENIPLSVGAFSNTSLYCIVIQLDIAITRAI